MIGSESFVAWSRNFLIGCALGRLSFLLLRGQVKNTSITQDMNITIKRHNYMAGELNNKLTVSCDLNLNLEQGILTYIWSCVLVNGFLFCLTAAALWRGVQAVSPVPSVPDHVQALVGSCVVIPCSFTPLASHPLKGRKERVDVRLRFRGGGRFFPLRSIAFNSEDRDQVSRDFQGRTSLFGQIADGDCSVKIGRISQDDARVFEIALKKGDDLLWGKPRSFNLDVVGEWGSHCTAFFFL